MLYGSFFSIVKIIKIFLKIKFVNTISLNLFYMFSNKYMMDKMDHPAYTVILVDIFQVFSNIFISTNTYKKKIYEISKIT